MVDKFTLLGSTLLRDLHIDDEVNARIAKASAAFDRSRVAIRIAVEQIMLQTLLLLMKSLNKSETLIFFSVVCSLLPKAFFLHLFTQNWTSTVLHYYEHVKLGKFTNGKQKDWTTSIQAVL